MYLGLSAYGGKFGFNAAAPAMPLVAAADRGTRGDGGAIVLVRARRQGGARPTRGEVLTGDLAQGVGFIVDGTSTKACRGRAVDASSALPACPGGPGEGASAVVAPRVLVDATDVPADRGALGRYVDGLIARSTSRARTSPWSASGPTRNVTSGSPRGPRRRRTDGALAPVRPAGLGAERAPRGGAAGQRRRHPRSLLLDAAAAGPAHRGDRARRHVLHRARALQPGRRDVLQVGDPDRRAAARRG